MDEPRLRGDTHVKKNASLFETGVLGLAFTDGWRFQYLHQGTPSQAPFYYFTVEMDFLCLVDIERNETSANSGEPQPSQVRGACCGDPRTKRASGSRIGI